MGGLDKETVEDLVKKISNLGYVIEKNNLLAVPHESPVWWYKYGKDNPILLVEDPNKKVMYRLAFYGKVVMEDPNNKKNYFYFDGKRAEGKLTEELEANNQWGTDCWFEITREVYDRGKRRWQTDNSIVKEENNAWVNIFEAVDSFIDFLTFEKERKI